MSTHIGAAADEISEHVLLPGDPLRAKWIAENFLTDAHCYSSVRNMLGFTGTYRGERISVQGTGMGQPSLSIYVHELCTEYGARTLVRVGSCGALAPDLSLRDVVLAMSASTDSAINHVRFEGIDFAPTADFELLRAAHDAARARGLDVHVGPVASWDVFYSDRPELLRRLAEYGVLAVEMETAALYTLAAKYHARGLALLTVSDSLVSGEETSAQEREQTFGEMVELALDSVLSLAKTDG
ncbi:MAG TPA: purine-nucleoside phosphorylase [Actinomycetes bacterium]|nr:purine-nucleoside phosphorylase [Actinomycetes bacterium]